MTKTATPILATRHNMREYAQPNLVTYDRYAHDEYSATAGDYFMMGEDEPLTGKFGKPLILCLHIPGCYQVVTTDNRP